MMGLYFHHATLTPITHNVQEEPIGIRVSTNREYTRQDLISCLRVIIFWQTTIAFYYNNDLYYVLTETICSIEDTILKGTDVTFFEFIAVCSS